MAQATVLEGNPIPLSASDPTADGEMVWTSSSIVEIDDCDATTNFSNQYEYAYFQLDQTKQVEGTGCVKCLPVGLGTHIIKTTVSAKNLSNCNAILLHIWRSRWIDSSMTLYFGESAYNEKSQAITVSNWDVWNEIIWNISAIPNADKDAVTIFAIGFTSNLTLQPLWVDYIRATASELVKIKLPSGVKTFTLT